MADKNTQWHRTGRPDHQPGGARELDHQAGSPASGPDHGAPSLVAMDNPDDSQLGGPPRPPREGQS